jgi:CDP-diacylglycerol--glycerol-3-phosphate 3-phosphatidyltransferase
MAVVVMGREMLVTAIRGVIEQQGGDFSAQMAGKLKMVFQCVAAVASLMALRHYALSVSLEAPRAWLAEPLPVWLFWTLHVSVALAVLSTLYSGAEYIVAAARILGKQGR